MAFSDLQLKAASESAVMAAHANIAKLALFSHTFTELDGRPGESIAVPVYDLSASGQFNPGTNDYGTGANEVGGMLINLDQHLVKSIAITDKELAYTGINWVKDSAYALADRITRDVNKYAIGLFNGTNVTLSATLDVSSKAAVANLYKIATDNDIPVDRAIVILGPTDFAKVLAMVDYNMIGSGDYIKTGVIENLFGFKGFVCSTFLQSGVKGVIALDSAMGVCSKYLAPMTPDAYPEAWAATDENGFTIGFRRFMNLNTGADLFACDALFGCKLLQKDRCVLLK